MQKSADPLCLCAFVPSCLTRSLIALCLILFCSGCNIFGWAAQSVAGTETKEASYKLANKPTVVVVEKFSNPAEAVLDDEPIARYITDDLREHKFSAMIDSDKVYAFRSAHPDEWKTSTIASVGRSVGAEQIIYVNLLKSDVEVAAGSNMMRGQGTVLVRVVDAKNGNTLWPIGQLDGASVTDETKLLPRGENHIYEGQLRTTLHRELSAKIGQLFYDVTKE